MEGQGPGVNEPRFPFNEVDPSKLILDSREKQRPDSIFNIFIN